MIKISEKTRNLLWDSIAIWEDRAQGLINNKHCPLCTAFGEQELVCVGCPIQQHVGKIGCNDTPYYKWQNAMMANQEDQAQPHAKDMLNMLNDIMSRSRSLTCDGHVII